MRDETVNILLSIQRVCNPSPELELKKYPGIVSHIIATVRKKKLSIPRVCWEVRLL